MKKIFYLLLACTMMCFAGCEEKGDEITTDNTGENVEINEANLVGTWKIVSIVEKEKEEVSYSMYYYDDHYEEYSNNKYDGERTGSYERLLWTYAFTIKADKTYEFEEEVFQEDDDYDNDGYYYYKRHWKEHGTWSLKGTNFSIQWIEGCREKLDAKDKADINKPYTEKYCNTFEEYLVNDFGYRGYWGYDDFGFYEYDLQETIEEGGEAACYIIKLTPTELVIQTKEKWFDDDENEWQELTYTYTFKKVK